MKSPLDVDLEEYRQLRAEVLTRLTLHNQLTSYAVTAMAAALAVLSSYPDVLLALSFLASWFWLLYTSHDGHIFRIAHYIAVDLAPRLTVGDRAVLGWEAYLRKFDTTGLEVRGEAVKKKMASKMGVNTSTAVIFGGSTPIMTLIFWLWQWPLLKPGLPLYGRMFATACVIIMWINASHHAWLTALLRKHVNAAIAATRTPPQSN